MHDRYTTIKGLKMLKDIISKSKDFWCEPTVEAINDAIHLLKEQEAMKQKMWNALYAEEDELEKKFVGSEDHHAWFAIYRPWLQRGFEIAIKVIAEQEGQ